VRKAIVTGGVSYHDALARPAQPFADFDALDVHELPRHELEAYGLVVVLRSVDGEAALAEERRARRIPRIAGVFSGVNFQRGFVADPELGSSFAVLPAQELEGADLARFRALWVPHESNQACSSASATKIEAYLRGGGAQVTFDKGN
jgi:hypothetical protein